MFIIDFDDTLFDTHEYKQKRMHSLQPLGVSEELFWKTYKLARNNELGELVYSDKRHAEQLEQYGFAKEKVMALLGDVNGQMKNFLFTDTVHFLEEIAKISQPQILLSLGDTNIQEIKVKGSGVDVFFDRIVFVPDTKVHQVKQILDHHKPEKVWFINDKVKETQEVLLAFPHITAILRQSPAISREEYHESGLPYFQTLTEILHYVEQSK